MLSLLELLRGSMLAVVAPVAARALGETEQSTRAALDLLMPVALGAMLQRCAMPADAEALYRAVTDHPLDGERIVGLAPDAAGARTLLEAAERSGLTEVLFDDRVGALGDAIVRITGARPQTAARLVGIAVATLAARLKSLSRDEGLSARAFAARLLGERPALSAALDRRLIAALGGTGAGAFLTHTPMPGPAIAAPDRERDVRAPAGLRRLLSWTFVGIAVLLLMPSMLRGCEGAGGVANGAPGAVLRE